MFKVIVSAFVFIIWFSPSSAFATSPRMPLASPPPFAATILKTWPVKIARNDKRAVWPENQDQASGCLAKIRRQDTNEEYIAFSDYDYVCQLDPHESIIVKLSFSYCDEINYADMVCSVQPRDQVPDENLETKATLTPVNPDKREIPDLVRQLETGGVFVTDGDVVFFQEKNGKIIAYAQDPSTLPTVQKYLPHLREIMNQSRDPYRAAAIAEVLQAVDPNKEAEDIDLNLIILKGMYRWNIDKHQIRALEVVQKHPEAADKIVPVLITRLQDVFIGDDMVSPIFEALTSFGGYLHNYYARMPNASVLETMRHFTLVQSCLPDTNDAERIKQWELQHPNQCVTSWKKLVCSTYTYAELRQKHMFGYISPEDCKR